MTSNWSPESLLAQALGEIEPQFGGVSPPIHTASTYIRAPNNSYPTGVAYGRDDNPTSRAPECLIARLENGLEGLLFASGMASAVAVFETLPIGAHIVAPKVMYWGLRKWLEGRQAAGRYDVTFADLHEDGGLEAAIQTGETSLVWIETPANPLWHIVDIAKMATLAHQAGAVLGVDSTAATPMLTRPIDLGADVVMHSATKYLNGHSDIIAGALAFREAGSLFDAVKIHRHDTGAIIGHFEAWLLLRGMRTLHLRVAAACRGALAVAERFANDPRVSDVLYPGLSSHPGHAIAARQMHGGFGGMLSIRVKAGEAAAVRTAARVGLWKRATSLGGVESLIEHRASIEGPGSPVPTDLLRLSVGIENPDDLMRDLDQALD
jgi:cystathionine gamma-synthase